jgi:cytochrome oxidase assembly protein ShyY1
LRQADRRNLAGVYRFLLSPRWVGLAALMCLAATVMVGLGFWQLHRYHERSTVNDRIDRAGHTAPVPLRSVLEEPDRTGTAGPAPPARTAWTRVSVSGAYDPGHEILARERTVQGEVGFEVLTPLVLADGSAVLVDRGWIPPARMGTAALPVIPPVPAGQVEVVGRVHAPESRASAADLVEGVLQVRRIGPALLAGQLPYALYGAYLTLESQNPPSDPTFVAIPPDHQNAAMNAGYVAQWWLLALLALVGYGYLAVREAQYRQGPMHRNWLRATDRLDDLDLLDALDRPGSPLPPAPISPAV